MINSKDLFAFYKVDKTNRDDVIDELMLDNDIKNLVYSNNIKPQEIEDSINTLLEYKSDTIINDKGIKESKSVPGFRLVLSYEEEKIKSFYIRITPIQKINPNIKLIKLPTELLDASLMDFSMRSEERQKAYQYARRFINNFKTDEEIKGMYISGPFKCGKTYLASAIANEIADKDYKVIMCYYPELSSILKDSYRSDSERSFIEIVDELKSVDLLVLDDFGGDSLNPTIRDEALGVILQYRMVKNKATIFTSNIDTNKLVDYCLRKDGSEGERIKALRIYERIKELTQEFFLTERYVDISF